MHDAIHKCPVIHNLPSIFFSKLSTMLISFTYILIDEAQTSLQTVWFNQGYVFHMLHKVLNSCASTLKKT